MNIEAGKYYRTRDGDVVGPMRHGEPGSHFPWITLTRCWTIGGMVFRGREGAENCMDLISEVYVSDTPPAPQVNTTKTARDELVEKAALAILTGRHANPGPTFSYGNKGLWSAAEEFVEARKK